MPRAVRSRTPFIATTAAASSSLFATLAHGGHVPIGAYDVVPEAETSTTQALVGQLLAERQVGFAIEDWATGETLLAGTVEQRVILEAEKRSLTFHYLVTNTPGPDGAGEVLRGSAFSFGEFVHSDVAYLADDGAAGYPSLVSRTDNAVDLRFDGAQRALGEGEAFSFFVRTNATEFDETGMFALDALAPGGDPITGSRVRTGVVDGMYRAVVRGPVAVPLPGPLWTGAIGLAAAAWARRKAKR